MVIDGLNQFEDPEMNSHISGMNTKNRTSSIGIEDTATEELPDWIPK